MKFISYFNLIFYIITNYNANNRKIDHNLIIFNPETTYDEFIPSDEYIMWHTKNIGTSLSSLKMTGGIIPFENIYTKSKKYYMNILINNKDNFLEYAFHDIFFEKVRIAICLAGFMRDYDNTIIVLKSFLKDYHVDYYVSTYNILDMKTYDPIHANEKFNIEDLTKILNIKNHKIKEYTTKQISPNKCINNLYYKTANIYDCYKLIEGNYFIYIYLRPDARVINLDSLIDNYFDDIINNKIILNGQNDGKNGHIVDGFAMCNIFIADIYFKFHLKIHTYIEFEDSTTEQLLFYYLRDNNISIILDNIVTISKSRPIKGVINKMALMKGHLTRR